MNSGTSFQKSYLPLDMPFNQNPYGVNSGISALNDLYPGRPMTIFGRYYEYEIPNEDPEGAKETYLTNRKETKTYAQHLQNMTLSEGGGDQGKVLVHAIEDPSAVIENPMLQGNSMQVPQAQNDGRPFVLPPVVESPGIPKPDILKAEELASGKIGPQLINPSQFQTHIPGEIFPGSSKTIEGYKPMDGVEGSKDPKIQKPIKKNPPSRWSDIMILLFLLLLVFIPFVMYGLCALG